MAQLYAHIDHDGNVINHVCYDESPDISILPPNVSMAVPNNVRADLGWKYSNGVFTDPSPQPIHVETNVNIPCVPKECSDIIALKTDIQNLTKSLSQVITALNGLLQEKIAVPPTLTSS